MPSGPREKQADRGPYRQRVSLGFDPLTGKRIRVWVERDTNRELELAIAKLRLDHAAGRATQGRAMTVETFISDDFLKFYKGQSAASTYDYACEVIQRDILPRLGKKKLTGVTTIEVRRWMAWLEEERSLQAATIKRKRSVLSAIFAVAAEWGLIPVNPVRAVPPPKVVQKEPRSFTDEELGAFLDVAQHAIYEPLWTIALATGVRPAELTSLQWGDIDVETGVITIKRSWGKANAKDRYLKEPKSEAGVRRMKLPTDVLGYLEPFRLRTDERRKQSAGRWNPHNFVVVNANGEAVRNSNLARTMRRLVREAGLVHASPKAMRHTNASLLFASGKNSLKVVQSRLGHADGRTTLRTYIHLLPQEDDAAADSLPRLTPKPKEATDAATEATAVVGGDPGPGPVDPEPVRGHLRGLP